jgi:hypothetical protein
MKARYPGPKPFTSNEQALFFGRKEETDKLNQLVYNNRITVLFGRSGYGKSSLVQAGVVPYFSSEVIKYKVIQVRFTSPQSPRTGKNRLQAQLITELRQMIENESLFLDTLTGNEGASLWQVFKTLQWTIRKKNAGILFVLDQFEEVFNFPEDYLELFSELSELVHNRMPHVFQEKLMNAIEANESFLELHKEEIAFIETEIPTSFLIGIRSDRIFLLDELGDSIPAIFNNRFSIGPLSIDKLDSIIREPALAEGDFDCPPFTYSAGMVEAIRKYLSAGPEGNRKMNTIEGFEFQIICQYIESRIIQQMSENPPRNGELPEAQEGIIQDGFTRIIENYYIDSINNLPGFDEFETLITRFLIERKLIDVKTDTRVCVDKTSILPIGFNNELLRKVIETRMVRKELNTVSGESFELSHDTLVKAIRQATLRKELGLLDDQILHYYNLATRNVRHSLFTPAYFLEKSLIDKQGNLVRLRNEDLSKKPGLSNNMELLIKNRIVKKEGPKGKETYILNETFQDTVIDRVNRNQLFVIRKYAAGLIGALVMIGIIILFTARALRLSTRENALRVASLTDINEEDDPKSGELVLLFNDLFAIIPRKDTIDKAQLGAKMVRQFNAQFPYSNGSFRDSLFDTEYSVSPDDSLILAQGNQFIPTSRTTIEQPKMAMLFDTKGQLKKIFKNVGHAAFFGGHLILITDHDSLKIYDADSSGGHSAFTPVRLINRHILEGLTSNIDEKTKKLLTSPITAADIQITDVIPISRLKNTWLSNFRIRCTVNMKTSGNGAGLTARLPTSITLTSAIFLGIVDLRTGEVIPLQTIKVSDLSSPEQSDQVLTPRPAKIAFPIYYLADSGRGVAALTQDGYKEHYLEYTDLRTFPVRTVRKPLPTGYYPVPPIAPLMNSDLVFLSTRNYDSIQNTYATFDQSTKPADPIRITTISVQGKIGRASPIAETITDMRQNEGQIISVVTPKGVMVLDEKYTPIFRHDHKGSAWNLNVVASPDRKSILFNEDSLLMATDKQKSLHGVIVTFAFSSSGDSIFCTTYENTNATGFKMHILNRNLEELMVLNNYANFSSNQVKGVCITKKGNKVYLMKLNDDRIRFKNTDPGQVASWISKFDPPFHLPDSLREKYHFIGGSRLNQLLSLIHDN